MDVIINYWAVIGAAIASVMIGMLWYSPFLFGKAWIRLMGKSEEEIKSANSMRAMVTSSVMTLISAYVLAHFVSYMEAATVGEALQLGFWVWIGFIAPLSYHTVLFEGKPKRLYLINASYHLVSMLVMSIILTMWQ